MNAWDGDESCNILLVIKRKINDEKFSIKNFDFWFWLAAIKVCTSKFL